MGLIPSAMEKEIHLSIKIDASPDQVWEILTNSKRIKKQLWGERSRLTRKIRSPRKGPLRHHSAPKLVVLNSETRASPPFFLQHNLFPEGWDNDQRPEHHISASYQLVPLGQQTELIVTQGDFSTIPHGDEHFDNAYMAWHRILPKIKQMAEN